MNTRSPIRALRTGKRRGHYFAPRMEYLERRDLLSLSCEPTLVRDIDLTPTNMVGSNTLTEFDGALYFATNDGVTGVDLWRSDGTEAGTFRVKDSAPGDVDASVDGLTVVNDQLFFVVDFGTERRDEQLWSTDGTEEGTRLVKHFSSDRSSAIRNLTEFNGTLFFTVGDELLGEELWKSDGTEEGTLLVKDILPGPGSSSPRDLTRVGDTLFFYAWSTSFNVELWKTDGSSDGTVLVKDIRPGTLSSSPAALTAIGDMLYFSADDGVNGRELWKSDGTEEGTILVADIRPGSAGNNVGNLTYVSGSVFFTADDGVHGRELWVTDGTPQGTHLVKDIDPGSDSGSPSDLIEFEGVVYFAAAPRIGVRELWKSDGTEAGTVSLDSFYRLESLVVFHDTLYFFDAYNELWTSNGEESAAFRVKDFRPDGQSASLSSIAVVGDRIYFYANDGTTGSALWTSDGTAYGTRLAKDIWPGTGSMESLGFAAVDSILFFSLEDGNGYELWKSDGTAAGTGRVKDIRPGFGSSTPLNLTDVNGVLYFTANEVVTKRELWKSDGTEEGTVLVKDISPGGASTVFGQFEAVNDMLFFLADDGVHGMELWRSDGTDAGTFLLKDIRAGSAGASIDSLTNVNGTLFFVADVYANGAELWKSDGTPEGTVVVKDIRPGQNGSFPSNLANVNGTLFFSASGDSDGTQLWRSDGTEAGTYRVKSIYPSVGSYPQGLTDVNGTLFFTARDAPHGFELWKSDGTDAGTVLIRDLAPGGRNSNINNSTNVDGVLFFTARDPEGTGSTDDFVLWKSDGTESGTVVVRNLAEQLGSLPYVEEFTAVGGRVFFTVNVAVRERALWTSDGTADGTGQVAGVASGDTTSGHEPILLTNVDGSLFFMAYDEIHGRELWAIRSSPEGDVDRNCNVDAADIDSLFNAIGSSASDPVFDLTSDSAVDGADVTYLVESILGTHFGDANLDGQPDRADLATVVANFGRTDSPGWGRGDFNGDGSVDLRDVMILRGEVAGEVAAAAKAVVASSLRALRAGAEPQGESADHIRRPSITGRRRASDQESTTRSDVLRKDADPAHPLAVHAANETPRRARADAPRRISRFVPLGESPADDANDRK